VLLLALAAAGLLGVFALVANYVSDVDTKVGPEVSVLVLTKDAKRNNAISDNMMTEKRIPRRWAPKSALDRSQVIGLVAGSDLASGSILQEGMLVSPPQLSEGEREVALLVDASTGVAGKIDEKSRVDIIAAFPGDQNGSRPNRSVVVVAGARVLAVGQTRLKNSGGVQDGNGQADPTQVVPVTFALTKDQELQVSYAQSFAQDVRLALVPPGEVDSSRTLEQTIFKGDDPKTGARDESCRDGC
jgi:pilus assembly protein CpaB